MQEPPAKRKIFAVCLKVIAVRLLDIVIFVVLQADTGPMGRGRGQSDDAGQVVATTKKVELDASQEGKE